MDRVKVFTGKYLIKDLCLEYIKMPPLIIKNKLNNPVLKWAKEWNRHFL